MSDITCPSRILFLVRHLGRRANLSTGADPGIVFNHTGAKDHGAWANSDVCAKFNTGANEGERADAFIHGLGLG
ncbi:hypothetical protein [Leucobacter komagatae]|uniref:hypothetical protein n=1 Tax=Leucobacter komagatae TaxID=55969 RepID=UPI00319E5981